MMETTRRWRLPRSGPAIVLAASAALASLCAPGAGRAQGMADEVTYALPVRALGFAPVFLANDAGLFAAHHLKVKIVVVRGGAAAIAAVLGGSAQAMTVANYEFLKLGGTGRIMRVLAYCNSLTANLTIRKAVLDERGITADMPVKERIHRLKGIVLGTISLGGATEIFSRWLMGYGGLDPQKDVRMQVVGGVPAMLGALKAGRIDGFLLSPPIGQIAEAQGTGKNIVIHTEIPQFVSHQFLGVDVSAAYFKSHHDAVARMVAAVAEAQKMLHDDPKGAAKILHAKSFKRGPLARLEVSLGQMRESFRSRRMSTEAWDEAKQLFGSMGRRDLADAPIKEGVDWTNELYPG